MRNEGKLTQKLGDSRRVSLEDDLEHRMRVIANLIIDRILEDKAKGKSRTRTKTMLKSN